MLLTAKLPCSDLGLEVEVGEVEGVRHSLYAERFRDDARGESTIVWTEGRRRPLGGWGDGQQGLFCTVHFWRRATGLHCPILISVESRE